MISLVVVASCSSPESKAKKAIREYMKRTMNDLSSYEPIEFGSVDSSFAISDMPWEKAFELRKKVRYMDVKHLNKDDADNIDALKDSLSRLESSFTGFMIEHTFRASNQFGAKMLVDGVFFFG